MGSSLVPPTFDSYLSPITNKEINAITAVIKIGFLKSPFK